MLKTSTRALALSAILTLCSPLMAQTADDAFLARYQLRKMVMVGRHGVRSASLTKAERRVTPHPWHQWAVGSGQLTERGALLEQNMGRYFREWTKTAGLFGQEDASHASDCYVYANSLSRTVNTAKNFLKGFMPQTEVEVLYNQDVAFGNMDEVFNNVSTITSSYFVSKVRAEAESACGKDGFSAAMDSIEKDAMVLAEVLDLSGSPACVQGDTCSFLFSEPYIYLHKNWMPRIRGGRIDLARLTAGDLLLQYYDAPGIEGTFGHAVSDTDIIRIGRIKEMWTYLSMGLPSIGKDAAHQLLVKLQDMLRDEHFHFVYLVGHDSNMSSLTGALGIKPYTLPDTPEMKTPLGGKLVFEIWESQTGDTLVSTRYVYQNLQQIRNLEELSMVCPPASYPLEISGLQTNADGLYKWSELLSHIQRAIDDYASLNVPLPYDVNLDGRVDLLDAVDIVKNAMGQPHKTFYQPQADVNGDGLLDLSDALSLLEIITERVGFQKSYRPKSEK